MPARPLATSRRRGAAACWCRAISPRPLTAVPSSTGRSASSDAIDILVNNAAFQRTYGSLEDIPDEEWSYTFRTNIEAMFHLAKAAVPHMRPGSSIINTTSIQSDKPSPMLLAYASTKGAVSNFTAGLAQMLGSKGIRVNAVAPGPIWTPLIPSTMPPEKVKSFGEDTPLGRARPAQGAGGHLRAARIRRGQLHDRRRLCRHRRHPAAVSDD